MNRRLVILSAVLWISSCAFAAKHMSAGILPYYYNKKGVAYFLIGKEPNGVWADFGGGAEQNDQDVLETAAREFSEETRYVYGKYACGYEVKKARYAPYKKASMDYIESRITGSFTHPRGYYRMYLAQVDYIPVSRFKHAAKVPHYEKRDYAWVPAYEFVEAIHKSKDRLKTYYGRKRIRKQFVDVIKAHYRKIMRIVD